jgi:hypothetical protein
LFQDQVDVTIRILTAKAKAYRTSRKFVVTSDGSYNR